MYAIRSYYAGVEVVGAHRDLNIVLADAAGARDVEAAPDVLDPGLGPGVGRIARVGPAWLGEIARDEASYNFV